jgi:hypothetical protein
MTEFAANSCVEETHDLDEISAYLAELRILSWLTDNFHYSRVVHCITPVD